MQIIGQIVSGCQPEFAGLTAAVAGVRWIGREAEPGLTAVKMKAISSATLISAPGFFEGLLPEGSIAPQGLQPPGRNESTYCRYVVRARSHWGGIVSNCSSQAQGPALAASC